VFNAVEAELLRLACEFDGKYPLALHIASWRCKLYPLAFQFDQDAMLALMSVQSRVVLTIRRFAFGNLCASQ
jgi:hypothetical protein